MRSEGEDRRCRRGGCRAILACTLSDRQTPQAAQRGERHHLRKDPGEGPLWRHPEDGLGGVWGRGSGRKEEWGPGS